MRMLYALSEDERYLENIEFMEEREGTGMCDLLDEAENRGRKQGIEQGREQGIEQGREQGIIGTVVLLCECGNSTDKIAKMLMKQFGLTQNEAMNYCRQYIK